MGAAFVRPEHRGRGLGKGLFPWLAKVLMADDMPVYTQTEVDNAVSIRAQKAIGVEIVDCPLVYWVTYSPIAKGKL